MRLPDDFWSVNENEPGIGGIIVALAVFILCLVAIFGWVVIASVAR